MCERVSGLAQAPTSASCVAANSTAKYRSKTCFLAHTVRLTCQPASQPRQLASWEMAEADRRPPVEPLRTRDASDGRNDGPANLQWGVIPCHDALMVWFWLAADGFQGARAIFSGSRQAATEAIRVDIKWTLGQPRPARPHCTG